MKKNVLIILGIIAFTVLLSGGFVNSLKAGAGKDADNTRVLTGGHAGKINTVTFSNDGKYFASGGDDNRIIVWDTDGNIKTCFTGHEDEIRDVVFTPDGEILISADGKREICMWSISRKVLLKKLDITGNSISISPDGKFLAAGYTWDNKHIFSLMNLSAGNITAFNLKSEENDGAVRSIRFSPDGMRIIVSIYNSGRICIFNKTGELLQSFNTSSSPVIIPDPKGMVYYSVEENDVVVINSSGASVNKFKQSSGRISCLAISSDGKYLASGTETDDDNSVKMWDTASGRLVEILKGHTDHVTCIAMSRDGRYIASGSKDETIKLWHVRGKGDSAITPGNLWTAAGGTGEKIPEMTKAAFPETDTDDVKKDYPLEIVFQSGHYNSITETAFSPDGSIIASASADHTVNLWNRSGILLRKLKGHKGAVKDIAFTPDGKHIVSAGDQIDGTIKIWSLSGNVIKEFVTDKAENGFNCISVSPDGNFIAAGIRGTGSGNCHLILCGIKSGRIERFFYGTSDTVNSLSFSPDGKYIICGGDSKTVQIWKTDGTLVRMHKSGSRIFSVAFSPDGSLYMQNSISPYGEGGEFILRKTSDGSIRYAIKHDYLLRECIFSPDGKSIAAVINEKWIGLHKIDDNKNQFFQTIFPPHDSEIYGLSFSPDGKFMAYGSYDTCVRICSADGRHINKFRSSSLFTTTAVISPDGKYLAQGGIDNTISLWETKGGYLRSFTYPGYNNIAMYGQPHSVVDIKFSPDGSFLASRHTDQAIRLWKKDGTLVKTFIYREPYITGLNFWIEFTSDGRQALIWKSDGLMDLIDTATGEMIHTYRTFFRNGIVKIAMDGTIFAVSTDPWKTSSNIILIYNTQSDVLRTYLECGSVSKVSAFSASGTGNFITAGLEDGTVIVWECSPVEGSITEVLRLSSIGGQIYSVEINDKNKLLLFSTYHGLVELWDVVKKESIVKFDRFLKGTDIYNISIAYVSFNETGSDLFIFWRDQNLFNIWNISGEKYIHSEHNDAGSFHVVDNRFGFFLTNEPLFEIWNLNSRQPVKFLAIDKEWLLFTPDGYWDGSRNSGKYIAMVRNMNIFGVDQFAVRNNRPDIIFERMRFDQSGLQAEYYRQYKKRINKLEKLYGIKESDLSSDLHVPKAEILKSGQNGKNLDLSIKLTDSKYNIVSYNIYVNDVPVYAEIGKKIKRTKAIDLTETIELSSGDNKIEVSCFNEKGAESYRSLTYATYDAKKKGNLYFIGFGVCDYRDESIKDLKYAENDVLDLAGKFSAMKNDYDNVYIKTYTGKDVTPSNIKSAKDFVKKASVDDTVILFISGHGMHDSDEYKTYYYLTQNTDMKNLKGTAADFETVEDILAGISPRKKLFLMDTCDSGELDDFAGKSMVASIGTGKGKGIPRTPKGLVVEYAGNKGYFDRTRFIYNDLFRRTGAIVFSSSKGGEVSWEFDELKNGAFTESILEGLSGKADTDNNGTVSIDELRDYVSKSVGKYTEDKQHPVIDRDNIYVKFGLPAK